MSQIKEITSISLASIWNQYLALIMHLKIYLNSFLIEISLAPRKRKVRD